MMHARSHVRAILLTAAVAHLICAAGIARARTDPAHSYAAHVARAAQTFALPEAWIWAVMAQESGGKPGAVSRAGAMGLMQIMPATWAELRARHKLGRNPYDPADNIMAGTAYLRAMHDRYGREGMLAAYNAGPKRYEDFLRTGKPLPGETQAYLARLLPAIGTIQSSFDNARQRHMAPVWTQSSLFPGKSDRAATSPQRAAMEVGDRDGVHDHAVGFDVRSSLFITRTGERP